MTTNSNEFKVVSHDGEELHNDSFPLSPGYIIKNEIEARGLKIQDVARDLDVSPEYLSDIISEKRDIHEAMAIKLEKVFDVNAKFWLRVQAGYDLSKAKQKAKKGT